MGNLFSNCNKLLLRECKKGNLKRVRNLIEKRGADPNYELKVFYNNSILEPPQGDSEWDHIPGSPFNMPMKIACYYGRLEIVKYLIEEQRVDTRNGFIFSALDMSSYCGHLDIVKYLVEKKGDIIYLNCIKSASTRGHFDVLKYLLKNTVVTKQEIDLVLDSVLYKGGCIPKIIRLLVSYGGDPYFLNKCELLFLKEKYWKKWRRILLRRWATRLLKVFYSPSCVGGEKDRKEFLNEVILNEVFLNTPF